MRKPDGNLKHILRRQSVGSTSSANDIAFNTAYRDNKLFYSFNLKSQSSVIDRAIGVVSDSTGEIKILTTCN